MLPPSINSNDQQLTKVFLDCDGCVLHSSFYLKEFGDFIKENKIKFFYNTSPSILKKFAKLVYEKNKLLFKHIIGNSTKNITFYSGSARWNYRWDISNSYDGYKNTPLFLYEYNANSLTNNDHKPSHNALFPLLINEVKDKYPKKNINYSLKTLANPDEPLFKYKNEKLRLIPSLNNTKEIKKIIMYKFAGKDNCKQLPPLVIFIDDSLFHLSDYIKPTCGRLKQDNQISEFILILYNGKINLQYNSINNSIKTDNKTDGVFSIVGHLNFKNSKIDDIHDSYYYANIESTNTDNNKSNTVIEKNNSKSSDILSQQEEVNNEDVKRCMQLNFNF